MGNKTITCQDCGSGFVFTEDEQKFFGEQGFGDPKRCKDCRGKKKDVRRERTFTKVVCADCGIETEVPFVPRSDKPVLCKACFDAKRR